ncbi:MAG: acyltransferase [Bacteroidales bacterium]|nr:acyltransferase [Bacteroidales bacterium]
MQRAAIYLMKGIKVLKNKIQRPIDKVITLIIFYANGVKHSSFISLGIPRINVSLTGECTIDKHFRMNNREMSNPIGRAHRCLLIVGAKGRLIIGNHVGISSVTIICQNRIEIGDYVKIGGNVVIYDTDFHSLNPIARQNSSTDIAKTSPVILKKNAFVGAHSTILKGVTIGENSIIGAGSVVTKSIPDNEIWGGNPARFLKSVQ